MLLAKLSKHTKPLHTSLEQPLPNASLAWCGFVYRTHAAVGVNGTAMVVVFAGWLMR